MIQKRTLAGMLAGAALVLGGASGAFATAACGDINNSGGNPDAIDSVGLAQVVLNAGTPVAGHCGSSGTLQCGDLVDDNVINSQDLVASLQIAAGIDTLLTPCSGFGPLIACGTTVSGTINTNQRWPAGCDTIVDGLVLVDAGAVITVQPGATVKGKKAPTVNGPVSALVFRRGTKLNAGGTAANPIVFTSDQAPGGRARGDWGGVTLLGNAPVNFPGGEGACEGLPPGTCNFGGTDPNDSSGQVRFTRIEYSGAVLSTDNELNIFTMNGVGRGTTIEFVQGNVGEDDGLEWFGGTVDVNHVVASAYADDGFDYQIGFTGSVQYGLSYQNIGIQISGHNGIEGDNNEFGFTNTPVSNPAFCNITVIGARRQSVDPVACTGCQSGSGANIRRGSAGKVGNAIFMDFTSAGLDFDDSVTVNRGCDGPGLLHAAEPNLRVQNTLLHNNGADANGVIGTAAGANCTPDELATLFGGLGLSNTGTNPLPSITGTYPTVVDDRYFPVAAGIADGAPDCSPLRPDVFEATDYIGAFVPGGSTGSGDNWLATAGNWISFSLN